MPVQSLKISINHLKMLVLECKLFYILYIFFLSVRISIKEVKTPVGSLLTQDQYAVTAAFYC